MAGIQNTIIFSAGEKLSASAARDILEMQESATDISRINHTGSPEGVVAANPSSLSHDPVSGIVYIKQTGTGNTGWAPIGTGSGTVTSVSGTANRITSTGGATPVIDIAATYVGQSSITTLGTITTGVWNGTKVAEGFGGTNQSTYATGDILYASGANTLSKLAAGSNTNVLTLAGGVPTWAAPTTGTVTSVSGTANRITSTGGATPVIDIAATYVGQSSITTLGTITTGVWNGTKVAEGFGGTNQATYATGDILYASGVNTLSKLAAGSNTNVLTLAGGVPTWAAPTTGTVTSVSGTANRITSTGGATPVIDIDAAYVGQASITTLGTITTGVWNGTKVAEGFGGTNQTTYATGDILYASGANTLAKLAAGSNTNVLTLAGGVPTWAAPTTGTVTSVSGTTNRITSTGGATPVIDISAAYVGQSSITTLGTITTGVWSGTAIVETKGGTNQTTYATGDTLYASGSNTLAKRTVGNAGDVLTVAGGIPTWAPPMSGTLQVASATLTSAQIKALHGTPVQLLAAPGAGKVLVLLSAWSKYHYGGTNVFTAAAGQTVSLYYSTTIAIQTGTVSSATLTGTSDLYNSPALSAVTLAAPGSVENTAIMMYNPPVTEISGNAANNNTVTIGCAYYVLTL